MEEIEFHHSSPIQLRFNDIDKLEHVSNTICSSSHDLSKIECFASVCPGVDWEKDGIVVVHTEADFLTQIFPSDHVAVQTAVCEIGTRGFHLMQRVIDTGAMEVKCICRSVMVALDSEKHRSKPLIGEWIETIYRFEGRDLGRKK